MKNIARASYVLFARFDAMITSIIELNFVYFVLLMDTEYFFFSSLYWIDATQRNNVDRNFIDVIIKIISKIFRTTNSDERSESAELDGWTDAQRHRVDVIMLKTATLYFHNGIKRTVPNTEHDIQRGICDCFSKS